MDWFPTLARYCGLVLPNIFLDGKDISQVIQDNNALSPHELLYWKLGEHWAVRKGPWKLVCNAPDGRSKGDRNPRDKFFLANLDEDPGESTNLADLYPGIMKELEHRYKHSFNDLLQ